jgi:hypothetical protein
LRRALFIHGYAIVRLDAHCTRLIGEANTAAAQFFASGCESKRALTDPTGAMVGFVAQQGREMLQVGARLMAA